MGTVRFVAANSVEFMGPPPEGPGGAPRPELAGGAVRMFFLGAEDEPQLFEAKVDPDTTVAPHAHQEDEIMYVLDGELQFGSRVYGPGSAVYIQGRTQYGFRSGPQGARFLNFRPRLDRTFFTRDQVAQGAAESGSVES